MKKAIITFGIIIVSGMVSENIAKTKIPTTDNLLSIYGFNSRPTMKEYANAQLKMDKDVQVIVAPLSGDDSAIDNNNELAIALLLSTNAEIVSTQNAKDFYKSITDKDVGLHSIFLIRDLARQFPDKASFYKAEEEKFAKMFNLSKKDIDNYCLETTKQYLQEYCKNNKYFTYYIPGTNQMTPEASIILKYLTAAPADRGKYKQDIIKITQDLTKKSMRDGKGSPAREKQEEFGHVISYYKDIESFVLPEIDRMYAQN